MSKNFTVKVTDEPFKNGFSLGKSVVCDYTGPNFLILAVEESTNRVGAVLDGANSADQLKIEDYKFEGHYIILLNAIEFTFEAAYITKLYKRST